MQRFGNEPLPPRCHIAVCGCDKVGNFVVMTPLLRGLKVKYPGAVIDFYGSSATQDLEEACTYLDARFSLYAENCDGCHALLSFIAQRQQAAGPYDLAINCNAFSALSIALMPALRPHYVVGAALLPTFSAHLEYRTEDIRDRLCSDSDWNDPALPTRYPDLLESNYIAEIFCALAYVTTDFERLEVSTATPSFVVPDVLIHLRATRSAKEWLPAYWQELLGWCWSQGLTVGIVGGPSCVENETNIEDDLYRGLCGANGIVDLRGRTSLTELAGAFSQARVAIVVDSGPMHIAAAVGCQTVCLFGNHTGGAGASPIYLWAPRGRHIHIVNTTIACTQCAALHFRNAHCLRNGHPCMEALVPFRVIAALRRALNQGVAPI